MLRTWLAVLTVLVLLCGCAGAEGYFSSYSNGIGLAVVGGEVYCAGANVGLNFIPICRIGDDGLETVCARIGGWRNLYALNDELLTVEPVLNLFEMLGSTPSSACQAKRLDPVTKKSSELAVFVWNTEDGICHVFAAQNKVYRDVCRGDQHSLERLDGDGWAVVAAWTGNEAWVYESYCVIGDRNADKPTYVALYEFATCKTYDVTKLMAQGTLTSAMEAVLEDGTLYRLAAKDLVAINLADGKKETLTPLPDGMDSFILTDSQMILMSSEHEQVWVLDRDGWQIVRQVKMTGYPQNAALHEGNLYVYCVYGDDAGVEVINLVSGESVWYSLE